MAMPTTRVIQCNSCPGPGIARVRNASHETVKPVAELLVLAGLQTVTDYRWYDISAKTPTFSNKGKTLVIQYTVKHEQSLDCGGGYIKLAPTSDQDKWGGDAEYSIMFGPDICGYSTKRVHVIFTYKGKNHLIKREIKPETDELTHIYTLIVKPDNTYEVQIDLKKVQSGSLVEDWDMLPPKKIKDPKVTKPPQDEWDERPEIDDPEDKKPDGYDDIPKTIVDPRPRSPTTGTTSQTANGRHPPLTTLSTRGSGSPRGSPTRPTRASGKPPISTTRISWTIPNSMLWSRTMALWGLSSGR